MAQHVPDRMLVAPAEVLRFKGIKASCTVYLGLQGLPVSCINCSLHITEFKSECTLLSKALIIPVWDWQLI